LALRSSFASTFMIFASTCSIFAFTSVISSAGLVAGDDMMASLVRGWGRKVEIPLGVRLRGTE
jgi:hypothetical protein